MTDPLGVYVCYTNDDDGIHLQCASCGAADIERPTTEPLRSFDPDVAELWDAAQTHIAERHANG